MNAAKRSTFCKLLNVKSLKPLRRKKQNQFTGQSANYKILGATLVIGVMTALANFASIGRHLAIAWRFGRNDEYEAFLIAWLVPSLLINVVAGSFNAAFIPTYIQVKEQEGVASSKRLFSGVTAWSSLLLTVVTLGVVITAPFYLKLVANGFSDEKLELTFKILLMVSPTIILNGTLTIWSGALNASERFVVAALTPTITPVLSTIFVLTLPTLKIYSLVVGIMIGSLVELIVLGIALSKRGILVIPRFYEFDSSLRQVATQYIPMVSGAFLLSSTSFVDKSMATMISSGSVAALDYGSRIVALPLILSTKALSTAVIPYFSKMVTQRDWFTLKQILKRYIVSIFAITIPGVILLVFFSEKIVEIIFQRGAFTSSDTYIVAKVSAFYAVQIPFYVSGILIVRLISAMKLNQVLMFGAIISFAVNILFNYILIHSLGVGGIALSTSLVYALSFVFLSSFCYLHLKKVESTYGQ